MKIIQKIKEQLGLVDYCVKHKIKLTTHGWYNMLECKECRKEMPEFIEKAREKLSQR